MGWGTMQVLTFDLDNTLWDVYPPLAAAEAAVTRWLESECPRAAERYDLERLAGLRAEIEREFPQKIADLSFIRRQIMHRVLVEAGCDGGRSEELFQVFFAARNRVELYGDVEASLASLARRFRLIALTDGNADLKRIGLAHHFEHYISASTVGAAKPNRAMFDAVLQHTGIDPTRIAHIGDDPYRDVGGAQAAGFRTIWVNRTGAEWPQGQSPPDAEVEGLQRLAEAPS